MNTSKTIRKIGVILIGLGIIGLILNFFNMYNIVSDCPNGAIGCQADTTWHLLNWLGAASLLFGLIAVVVSFIKSSHDK